MAPNRLFFADFHNHALPGMHDGPRTVDESLILLQRMRQVGICRVMLTPTYRPFFESVRRFRLRRADAWRSIARGYPRDMQLGIGALVALEAECCAVPEIAQLALPGTQHLLVELPLTAYPDWFDFEMHLLIHRRKLKPIFAGFERCAVLYSPEQLEHLFTIPGAAYQFSLRAVAREDIRVIIRRLRRLGKTVLLGTGAHSPGYDLADVQGELFALRDFLGNPRYTSLLLEEFNFADFRS